MATKHRKRSLAATRAATVGVATATVAALAIGAAPPSQANAATLPVGGVGGPPSGGVAPTATLIDALGAANFGNPLLASLLTPSALASTPGRPGLPSMPLAPGAPDPASIPDLTFGLGSRGYDALQTYGAQLESAILDNINLAGVLERLGYDPETAINTALGNALVGALTGVSVPVAGIPVLGAILNNAGINNAAAILKLLGFNLADPLNLSGAATPGLNIITAGAPFTLFKFLGVDLGWVPGFPNSVADEINGTPYLGISPYAILQTLRGLPTTTGPQKLLLDPIISTVEVAVGKGSALDVRVPVVIGFGTGAFAAGMAYPQVVADLANQPGGANNVGTDPLAGSITILPMILLRNPGRANGGLFARFYPEAGLLGIDTVTPDTAVSSSSDGTGLNVPVGNTGIVLGGANLIPIKIDATVEYDPLSDVPAWPNPFALANSGAALLFPTYLLRGITAASLTSVVGNQLTPQLAQALANTSGPLALNLYLTVPVNGALPLLEPVRLPIDVINLFTGANLNNPIATALEPALTTLVNLGYTDVKRTVVNGVPVYDRTLDQGNVITPFGTLPSGVDFGQVPGDLIVQLAAGIQKAASQGLVGSPGVNPLAVLASLLGVNLPGATTAGSGLTGLTALPGLTTGSAGATVPAAVQAQNRSASRALAGNDTPDVTQSSDPTPDVVADDAAPTTDAGQTDDVVAVPTPPTTPAKTTTTPAEQAKKAQANTDAAANRAAARLDKIARDGQKQIQSVLNGVQSNLQNALKGISGTNGSTSGTGSTGSSGAAGATAGSSSGADGGN